MKVIICGAGQVGWQIARHLSGENNDVTVVDNNPDLVRRATDTLDVQGLTGFASYPDVLEKAGARDADMIIAATFSDEVNMVTCQVAHSVFAVPRKIARLRARSYLDAIYSDLYRRDHLPIDVVISPEEEVAQAALARIRSPATFDTESFLSGEAQMLGIQLDADCPVLDTPLRQLSELFSTLRAIVVGVRRKGTLFAPEPGDQLFAGDQIYVFTHAQDAGPHAGDLRQDRQAPRARADHRRRQCRAERGPRPGDRAPTGSRTRVIEKSRARAEVAADALERTIVLHGDGLDMDILREAGVERVDAVLCVTDDDKTNLLASVRAKSAGAGLAIALVNDPTLLPLMGPLGIDAHINPRATHRQLDPAPHPARAGARRLFHRRRRGRGDRGTGAVDLVHRRAGRSATSTFPRARSWRPCRRAGKVVRPTGSLRIEEGDSIVIFALAADVPAVETLLQVSIDFF